MVPPESRPTGNGRRNSSTNFRAAASLSHVAFARGGRPPVPLSHQVGPAPADDEYEPPKNGPRNPAGSRPPLLLRGVGSCQPTLPHAASFQRTPRRSSQIDEHTCLQGQVRLGKRFLST